MRSAAIVALGFAALAAVALLGYGGAHVIAHATVAYSAMAQVMKLRKPASRDTLDQLDVDVSVTAGSSRTVGVPSRSELEPGMRAAVGKFPNWIAGIRAAPHEKVKLVFMLRHSDEVRAQLEETLYAVSTPGKPRYGQHLTYEQVKAMAAPVAGSREAVLEWCQVHGVQVTEDNHDSLRVIMSVQTAEAMFSTTLRHFTHKTVRSASAIRAAEAYTVPTEVAFAISTVAGLVRLPYLAARPHVKVPKNASTLVEQQSDDRCSSTWCNDCQGCNGFTTPAVLRKRYGAELAPNGGEVDSDVAPGARAASKMAISQFQGVSWDHDDLKDFRDHCSSVNYVVEPAYQNGVNYPGYCQNLFTSEICLESLLDIQYSKAMCGAIPLQVYSQDDYSLESWAILIQTDELSAPLHSVSYGNDEVQQDSPQYIDAVNDEFMKAGVAGKSILFASGDMGVWGRTGREDDGKFHPDFPGASPYITSVGGTNFVRQSVIGEESSWGGSGGGFSNHSSMPPYQAEAVAAYLERAAQADGFPTEGAFNPLGRGYPDVSALGGMTNPYCVDTASLFGSHMMVGVGGTSASCPAVSGMFARINGARERAGQPNMGFLNPFIYQNADAFHDVTKGNNNDGEAEGFRALAGWDPATGMGTLNFPLVLAAAMATPTGGTPGTYPPLRTYAPTPAREMETVV